MRFYIRQVTTAAVVCGILGFATNARAEPRTHDGFQMQLSGGFGYYSSSSDFGGLEQSYSGLTLPTSLLLGGTVMPNLTVGGGLIVDYASSPGVEFNGMEQQVDDVSQFVVGIGVYGDYYLQPGGGTHIQGFVGWGGLETSSGGNVGGSDPTGLVISVGGGYDWFFSDEWSVGAMGRLTYGMFSFNEASFPTIAPALLGTLTYH